MKLMESSHRTNDWPLAVVTDETEDLLENQHRYLGGANPGERWERLPPDW